MQNKLDNFYVIYLVRDPGAVLHSRLDISSGRNDAYHGLWDPKTHNQEKICQVLDHNLEYMRFLAARKDPFLQQIKLIRYEDFSYDPIAYTLDIYQNFLDFKDESKYYETIVDWMKLNALGNIGSHSKSGKYSTHKNSKETCFKWMKQVDFEFIDRVQNFCGRELFDAYGWRWFKNSTDFLNMEGDLINKSNFGF